MAADISFPDYREIIGVAYTWTESYDTQDWARLRTVMGPSIRLDFREVNGQYHEALSVDQYVEIIEKVIGDACIKTQHLLGLSELTRLPDGKIEVRFQARVAHQRYAAADLAEVSNKGHAYGFAYHTYEKIDGAWKIVGIKPKVNWFEYDLFGTLDPDKKKKKARLARLRP